jgi:hypothetical protein
MSFPPAQVRGLASCLTGSRGEHFKHKATNPMMEAIMLNDELLKELRD